MWRNGKAIWTGCVCTRVSLLPLASGNSWHNTRLYVGRVNRMASNITNVDNWLIVSVVLYMMLFLETSNIGDNIWQMAPDSISRDVEAVHTASNVLISHLPGCAKTKKNPSLFCLEGREQQHVWIAFQQLFFKKVPYLCVWECAKTRICWGPNS